MAAFRDGRFEAAASGFRAVQRAHAAAGDELRSVEAANNLSVALLQAGHPQDALEAVRGTPELLARLGDPRRAAQAYGNLAAALEACKDFAGAEAAYNQASELFASLGDDENRSHTLRALSQLQLARGRPLEAVASMQAGLAGQTRPSVRQRVLRWLLRWPARLLGR